MSTPTLTRAAELLECEAAILRESCTDADGARNDDAEAREDHDEMLRVAGELRAMIADAPQPPAEAAQPADVAQTVAWARVHPDGSFAGELLLDDSIEDVRKRSGAWVPLSMGAPADVALLQRALGALEYHREQTRPIAQTDAVIEALRAAIAAKGSDHA